MEPQATLTEIATRMDAALAQLAEERKNRTETRERIAALEVEIQQLTDQFNAIKGAVLNAEPSVLPQ